MRGSAGDGHRDRGEQQRGGQRDGADWASVSTLGILVCTSSQELTVCPERKLVVSCPYEYVTKYEIHFGRRIVAHEYSVSALQAAVDYVRMTGVKDDEIRRLGVDSVSWRGANFKAVLAPAES